MEPDPHSRRHALRLLGGAGLGLIAAACSTTRSRGDVVSDPSPSTSASPSDTSASATTTASNASSCSTIPEETAGPYPGDGSNGMDVLNQQGVVRSDIRASFGSASAVAAGVPLTVTFRVVDSAKGCAPLGDAAVYAWHCDRDGNYSLYAPAILHENYLRGVQPTGADGTASFTTIFPGCYSGRWPHIHFEVYPSVDAATSGGPKIATSQLALPEDVCDAVYATDGYSASMKNLSHVSLATDMVFSDGATLETPQVTATATDGYVATLVVGV